MNTDKMEFRVSSRIAGQFSADTCGVELLEQFIHFPGADWANCRSTDSFHAFISACEENRLLLKCGIRTGAGAGATRGCFAQSRYLAW
jgi:hypothetical protein